MIKKLFQNSKATATDSSVAIAGDNSGRIEINTGLGEDQYRCIADALEALSSKVDRAIPIMPPGDAALRDPLEKHFDDDIDSICEIIKNHKQKTALFLLTRLYERVASTASGRIRFRILANMGVCHFLNGDNSKAAELLLEACLHAPEEQKAASNRMFAYIVLEKWQEAYDYASGKLRAGECNGELVGYMLQAARHIECDISPLEIVPEALKDDPNVIVGMIVYSQGNSEVNDWWNIAAEGALKNPEDATLAYLSSVAVIDKALKTYSHTQQVALPNDVHVQVVKCSVVLQKVWDSKINSEAVVREEDIACANNLLVSYLLTRDVEPIIKICDHAVAHLPAVSELMSCVANAYLQIGRIDSAKKALNLSGDSQTNLFIRFQIDVHEDNIEKLSCYTNAEVQYFPQNEQTCALVIIEIAKLKKHGHVSLLDQFSKIYKLAENDARALIIIAEESESFKCPSVSELAYRRAIQVIGPHIAERVMAASAASRKADWKQVIDLLNDFVPTTTDSNALWILSNAYLNQFPITTSAIKFFERLPNDIRFTVKYSVACGQLYYRYGDTELARMYFSNARDNHKEDIQILLALLQVMLRDVDHSGIRQIVSEIDLQALKGKSIDKMHLANYLFKYGRCEDGRNYAFKALYEDRNNTEVAKAYFELFLLVDNDNAMPMSTVVAPGYWFSLINQHGNEFECIMADEIFTPDQFLFCNNHPLVISSSGLSVGSYFEISNEFGITKWTVTNIKHKFLYALHAVMSDFDARFTHSGMVKVSLQDEGDIKPLLDTVKKHSESQHKLTDLYRQHPAPLALIAHKYNMDVICFAELCIRNGVAIITGPGDPNAFASAVASISVGSCSKVVLDTYTAWRIAVADMFSLLKAHYSEIIVARSSLDELNSLSLKSLPNAKQSSMSLSYVDGIYLRDEKSPEEQDMVHCFINEQCEKIRDNCSILPVAWDSESFHLPGDLFDPSDPHFWDTAILALQTDSVLLSDDMYYREWSRNLFKISKVAYTFALLRCSFDTLRITNSQYASYLVTFSFWKHTHLFVTADILLAVLDEDTSIELRNFVSIADNIGGANAEWISHALVCNAFFVTLWQEGFIITSKVKTASAILLSKFYRNCPDWAMFFMYFYSSSCREFKVFLNAWRVGHMLPKTDLDNALERIRKQSHS